MPASDGGSSACMMGTGTQSGGTQYCSTYGSGNIGSTGESYNIYSNGQGSACMTVFSDATFKCTFTNTGDFLGRVGLGFNETQTPSQLGTVSADFAETHTGSAGYSYIGIYGWSVNPTHEYYIVEDTLSGNMPSLAALGGGTSAGSFTVDGDTYDVYTHQQVNQPTITGGNGTFTQFWSVRRRARQCGHISISSHWAEWATLGLQLGNMEEARIVVEAGSNGNGNIDFTVAKVTKN